MYELCSPAFCRKFVDSIRDNPGKLIVRAHLAETLKKIRDKGFQEFYNGSIAEQLLEDIRIATCAEHGKSPENCNITRITHSNFSAYSVRRREPLQFAISGSASTMYTVPAPGSGTALALFLKLMQGEVDTLCNTTVTVMILNCINYIQVY